MPPRRAALLFRACFGESRLVEFEALASRYAPQLAQQRWVWNDKLEACDGGDIGPHLVQPLPLAATAMGALGIQIDSLQRSI